MDKARPEYQAGLFYTYGLGIIVRPLHTDLNAGFAAATGMPRRRSKIRYPSTCRIFSGHSCCRPKIEFAPAQGKHSDCKQLRRSSRCGRRTDAPTDAGIRMRRQSHQPDQRKKDRPFRIYSHRTPWTAFPRFLPAHCSGALGQCREGDEHADPVPASPSPMPRNPPQQP